MNVLAFDLVDQILLFIKFPLGKIPNFGTTQWLYQ